MGWENPSPTLTSTRSVVAHTTAYKYMCEEKTRNINLTEEMLSTVTTGTNTMLEQCVAVFRHNLYTPLHL